MNRTISATVSCRVSETADMVWSVAAARGPQIADELLTMTLDGVPMVFDEVVAEQGTRLHLVRGVPPGQFELAYEAAIQGQAPDAPFSPLDGIVHRRPSRYCDSDTLAAVAGAHFDGLEGTDLLHAVTSWVGTNLAYVPGSSRPIDGSVDTFLARAGVCRDFAHLAIALLRARNVPARLASVYAPGLWPMDFHAVAEAHVAGAWHVVDATALAPRSAMVRVATGRDASDTAFLTVQAGRVDLGQVTVGAVVEPGLPTDDATALVRLR